MKPETRNPWPFSIITFFVLAILGCGTMVVFCSRHPADLITANYYEEELHFQGQVERVNRTRHLAAQTSIVYDEAMKCLTIALPPEQTRQKVIGSIHLYRPSTAALDRTLKLEVDSTGTQRLDAATLLPGLWKVRVSWTVENQDYFTDQKIVIEARPS